MSANDGSEQCQAWAYADCEIHITADIAYAVWHHYLATGDFPFLAKYGAEILVETARYWATRSHYSREKRAYVIPVVKGPDEYCGVTSNNAYTNMMAAHNLRIAAEVLRVLRKEDPGALKRLSRKLGLSDSEPAAWKRIADRMYLNRDPKRDLIIQDDTFLCTEPCDVNSLIADGRPAAEKIPYAMLHRLRIIKQADVILMMYLLNDRFSDKEKRAAWKFYLPLTVHDSSLSYNTHSILAAQLGYHALAYDFFRKTVRLDIDNTMGNTDKGVHAASLGGTWQTIVNGFAGMRIRNGILSLNPHLPKVWKAFSFHIRYRERLLRVEIRRSGTRLDLVEGRGPVTVLLHGKKLKVG
jgi:alpha,alpha-trehalose phosphorylase